MTQPALHTIQNDQLAVRISACGAEPQSIVCNGIERLWCADASVWGRHAPLLFPLIGRLRDGFYELDGQRIEAPTHGFCRDRAFEAQQLSSTTVRFSTSHDAGTQRVFPFAFNLAVEFRLEGNTLVKTHVVENTGDAPLPFELGGHEAYATCLEPGERMSDYYVQFEGLEHAEMFGMDESGILRMPKEPLPLEEGRLTKTPEQLGIDTVVLENVPGSTATLACAKNSHRVTVEFPDFPYLGIWTKALGGEGEARYLCIEPWSALPDAYFSPRELAEKPGVRTVAPGESVTLSYRMTFV